MNDIQIMDYSDKAIVVFGEGSKHIKDKLKAIGARFNPNLKNPISGEKMPGWILQKNKQDAVQKLITGEEIEIEKPEEVQGIQIMDYSDKAIVVFGEGTREFREQLKNIGAKYNQILKNPKTGKVFKGWIVSKKKRDIVEKIISGEEISVCIKRKKSTKSEEWFNASEKKEDNTIKWKTLKHKGVLFPPDYVPLPPNVRLKYKGQPVVLNATKTESKFNVTPEEAAVFFAMKIEQDNRISKEIKDRKRMTDDPVFKQNFWKDWKYILDNTGNTVIKDLDNVDFKPIINFLIERAERKKSMTKEEKKEEKLKKEEVKKEYGFAEIDGVQIQLGNYHLQPPGLYIGHGNQPLRGKIIKRLSPSDITLNISKGFEPKCKINGRDCKWGGIVENRTVTWIATWRHPLTEDPVYVYLKREASKFVCSSDIQKFEKARNLGKNIEEVRKKYGKDLKSNDPLKKQLATAVYLLDILAIRPGTEKDETKEAGTLGLTTLSCENIEFLGNNMIKINFIGKSSIEFLKTFTVDPIIYKNLSVTCGSGKKGGETRLFPKINANSLNGYLKTLLPGLTAKVFRTYKASSILQQKLALKTLENTSDISLYDPAYKKKIVYDEVNIDVALALNHKKMSANDKKIEKLKNTLEALKKEIGTKTTAKQDASLEKKIKNIELKIKENEENISMATSKVNYLDPRIVVAWCKNVEMPIEKIYNKLQLKKFTWAMEIPPYPEWSF